jgi:hypothetical protein
MWGQGNKGRGGFGFLRIPQGPKAGSAYFQEALPNLLPPDDKDCRHRWDLGDAGATEKALNRIALGRTLGCLQGLFQAIGQKSVL